MTNQTIRQPAKVSLQKAWEQVMFHLNKDQLDQAIHHLTRIEHMLETPAFKMGIDDSARYPSVNMIQTLHAQLKDPTD